MDEPTDTLDDVVAAARRGDDAAIAVLFTELQPRLLRFMGARSDQAVDDLASEVWLAVAQRIEYFDGDWNDFRKWFFTIAHRRVADHHRTNHTRRSIVEGHAFDDRSEAIASGSDELVLDKLTGEQAAKLVASALSPDQAEVVLLRVFGDLDAEQVGAIMHRSPGWVRVTQHRALRRLATFVDAGDRVTP